ncbi:MAG TPA: Rieske (2Fe-2S) protein [Solirubrobacteraceae bacterium]
MTQSSGAQRPVRVGQLRDIPPGSRIVTTIAGRSIGVFNVAGELFAVRNRCPHQGGPLCLGPTTGLLESDSPGQRRYGRQGEILRCPWHGWEFDLRDGRSIVDPQGLRVKSYDVLVGALAVETFPVVLEGDDVCVLI